MALIEARGVSHTYNGANNVLDGVDLTVERGEFVSVLGASGSGKTTLISILGGIERPSSGSVFLDGAEITRMKERQLAVLRRTKLGFVFQFFNLAPYLTAEQNILVPVYLAGKKRSPSFPDWITLWILWESPTAATLFPQKCRAANNNAPR